MVGQTDAGETIYEVKSARLLLRADAAHFNRLVHCSKCGREVRGRAVLGPADLDHLPQPVVCNDCVEAATDMGSWPGLPAEAVATDEPAVAEALAEMNLGPAAPTDEQGGPGEGEADVPDALEPEEAQDSAPVDEPADVRLRDDDAGLNGDQPPALGEAEAPMIDTAAEEGELPVLTEDDVLPGLDEGDPGAPEGGGAPAAEAGWVEDEPFAPTPEDEDPVTAEADAHAGAHLGEQEPEPAFADVRPDDDGLARRIEALEERLAGADPDAMRMVALEETVHRLAERAEAQASLHGAIEARMDDLAGAAAAAQEKQDSDELRRQLDQMGERLERLQATIDAEWARTKSETATLAQTLAALAERVGRLAQQPGDTAEADRDRLTAVEEKVDQAITGLANALEAQRRELQEGLRAGLADLLSASPPPPAAPAPAEDVDRRLRAVEKQVRKGKAEVSELNELNAALDAGLGVLRSELGDIRTALGRLADGKDDLEDRLETFLRMSLVPEGERGRKAKKAAESTMGTLAASVQDLLREQRQLKDSVAGLAQASDAAKAAAGRASTQVASLGPLRGDVKLLHQELVEQQEALDALRGNVERLLQAPAAAPPPAKRPAKKAAPTGTEPTSKAAKESSTAKAPAAAKARAARKATQAKKA